MNRRMAVVVAGALMASGPVSAQSEGERLRALEELIAAQAAELERQAAVLDTLRAELAALRETAPNAAEPSERVVTPGTDRAALALYGQVSRGILYYSDGAGDDVRHVDNNASATRIGLRGRVEASPELTIGSNFEVQFESNSTGDVNQADNTAVGPNNFTQRKLELFFESARFGTLWLGQGDTASNKSADSDLSGTGLVGSSAVADLAGGLDFRLSGSGALSGVTVDDVFDNLDGLSRDDRLRYDTPEFGGFVVSSSLVDGGEWDVGLGYGAALAAFEIEAKLGYANQSATRTFPEVIVTGSVSVSHESGVNATFAAGLGDDDDSSREGIDYRYGKLGYFRTFFPIGASHLSIDFGEYDDSAAAGDEGGTYGAQFVQDLESWGTEIYGGYRNYSLDRPGASLDDIDAVLTGARIKF